MCKHRIMPEYGERAHWRGTGRPNLSRETNFSGAKGEREEIIFPVQLTMNRIVNLTRLIRSLLYVMTVHEMMKGRFATCGHRRGVCVPSDCFL